MAALSNSRHERFAQGLAKGLSQSEAYEEAGYKPSRSAAARLAADVNICERVSAIQNRAAERTEISVASITERLLAIATKAEKSGDAPMLQAARASLMDAAKLNGLVVEKGEHQHKHVGLSVTYVTLSEPEAPASPEDYETGE
ncbi:terminase small subunit [Bacteriophage sp. 438212]|nr:terminase small subunit [Bacteriophage sp. 438212]